MFMDQLLMVWHANGAMSDEIRFIMACGLCVARCYSKGHMPEPQKAGRVTTTNSHAFFVVVAHYSE